MSKTVSKEHMKNYILKYIIDVHCRCYYRNNHHIDSNVFIEPNQHQFSQLSRKHADDSDAEQDKSGENIVPEISSSNWPL